MPPRHPGRSNSASRRRPASHVSPRRLRAGPTWLRGLPLEPAGAPVLIYTGVPKWRQDVHVAVIDIDVGSRDLQQCADAIMRLRGEWLFSAGRPVAFNDTDGKRRTFSARDKSDHAAFRKYMDLVFAYAGTYSLEHELKPAPLADIQIGDVFVKGGFPGHACSLPT
jgi:Domain of unknown function (4846)